MIIERYTTQQFIQNGDVSVSQKQLSGHYKTHWHEYYEAELILDGSGSYEIDGQSYPLRRGALFLMTPVNFHSVSTEHATIINLMFSDSACPRNALFPLLSEGGGNVFFLKDNEIQLYETLTEELSQALQMEDMAYASALLQVLLLKIGQKSKPLDHGKLTHTQTALLYLLHHFRFPVTLSEVAAHVGISPAYLSQLFATQTGHNFKEYLSALRFEYAKKLLLYSDMTVSEVCYESGFEDYANFLRRFKERFCIPPKKYRLLHKQGDRSQTITP